MCPKSDHKSKYKIRNFSYSKKGGADERNIPGGIRLSILFSGVIPFIGIVFTISGLGFLIPAIFGGIPLEFMITPLIFPLIGMSMLLLTLRKRIKYLRIMKTGKFTLGTFQRYEATNVRVNNSTVYRYYFCFTDSEKREYTVTGDTHTGSLSDESKELLAYNPDNPNQAVLIDIFPYIVKKHILSIIKKEKETDVIPDFF